MGKGGSQGVTSWGIKYWGGYLYWQQENPLTGSTQSEATAGYLYADEESGELDPLGNDVGRVDVYAAEDELSDYGGAYAAGGNAFDESGGGCEWNGLPVNCSTYAYALNSGYTKMIGDVPRDGRGWNPQGQPNPYVSEEKIGTKIERELWARFDNAAEYGDSLDSWRSPMWVVDAPHLGANGAMETMGSGRFVHAPQNNPQTRNLSFLLDLLEANLALQKVSCRNLFGSDVDPSSLLVNLVNSGSIMFSDLGANGSNAITTPVFGSETVTSPDGTSFRRNTGVVGATITINSNAAAPYQSGYGDRFGTNNAINRAITLIHELGHAANLIYGGGFGPSAEGSPAILNDMNPDGTPRRLVSGINSTRVHQACFQ